MFVTRCEPERSRMSRGMCGTSGSASAKLLKLMPSPGVVLRRGPVPGEQVVEPLEGVIFEPQGDRALRVVELSSGARPDDGGGDPVLMQQPGQRDVGRLLAELVAQVLVGLDLRVLALDRRLRPAPEAPTSLTFLLEHAAEQPAVQRGPGG